MEPCAAIYYDEKSRAVIGEIVPDDFPGDAAGLSFGYIEAMEDTVQVRCPLRGYLSIIVMMHRVYPALMTFWDREGRRLRPPRRRGREHRHIVVNVAAALRPRAQ